jgi:D-alanyl-D-alanine carboxypeptidase
MMDRNMAPRLGQYVRNFVLLAGLVLLAACSGPHEVRAAPYAAHVMDARTGETLYAENADTRLHPASLTKMMTLYIAFEEIERGNLSLDTMITVTKNAAAQPPSRLQQLAITSAMAALNALPIA